MSQKKSKLLLAHAPLSCPICHDALQLVSGDGIRFIVRHSFTEDCKNDGKCWSIPQLSIMATEI